MKRFIQQYLFSFSLIVALLLDFSGSFANGCNVEAALANGCCCCEMSGEEGESCCCSTDSIGACNCSVSQEIPAMPPVRQADETRSDYQRTLISTLQLPKEEGGLNNGEIKNSLLTCLLSSTRRRAILCCWMT